MAVSVFDFKDYISYLLEVIRQAPARGRGMKSALAEAIRCQTPYVSQVFGGISDFSLEQAEAINRFLDHTEEESSYFLLLVLHSRAGTPLLKKHFQKQLAQILEKRLLIKERLNIKATLSRDDQITYYSAWYYGAVHIVLSLPDRNTKEAIADYLDLPVAQVASILEFLISVGLAENSATGLRIGSKHLHLGKDSNLLAMHHTHWRLQAIRNIESRDHESLHYSSAVTISRADAQKVKMALVNSVADLNKVVQTTDPEAVFSFCLDFFEL